MQLITKLTWLPCFVGEAGTDVGIHRLLGESGHSMKGTTQDLVGLDLNFVESRKK